MWGWPSTPAEKLAELPAVWPTMPVTVIAERIGWTRGITVLKERVAELRPAFLAVDPSGRTSYEAGKLVQCDFWFPENRVPVGFGQTRSAKQLPVLTMGSGYSRGGPVRQTIQMYTQS